MKHKHSITFALFFIAVPGCDDSSINPATIYVVFRISGLYWNKAWYAGNDPALAKCHNTLGLNVQESAEMLIMSQKQIILQNG